MTVQAPPPVTSGIGPRERRWLVLFLILGSAYFGFLLAERILGVIGGFSSIFLIVFLAWLLAFVMSPLVASLEARLGLPRPVVVGLTYLVAMVGLGFFLFYSGSAITQQVTELAANYPETERSVLATLATWQESLEFGRLRIDLLQLFDSVVAQTEALGGAIFEQAQAIAGVTIAALGSLFLIIILSLYMLMDSERILGRLKALVPRRYAAEADIFERSVARAFGGFLRAQLILAAMQAALVGVVGGAFGMPYLFLIGTLSALAMLIPFFGPPLALIPPIVAAAIYIPDGFVPVTIILVAVQTIVVNWLQPRLMRGALGLHPILVLVGLLVGAQVAGVWGALFGIPVIAVLWVFTSYLAFRTLPNAALPERERRDDVEEHTMVSVAKEQVGDETHPHIHVSRTRRPDGSEQIHLQVDEDAPPGARRDQGGDAPA